MATSAGDGPRRPPRHILMSRSRQPDASLAAFHPAVQEWFTRAFAAPTLAQRLGWPPIARGESTLLLAPTGSGKTLAAFLWCIDRLMFGPVPAPTARCRILYVSPLKALAVDVERNLRAPIAGIANLATQRGEAHHVPAVAVRTGDTPATERTRFQRDPADILITTPESLYLLLTSQAREALRSVDTVIVDEIHALVPTKRGAHLALSLERLEALAAGPIRRIGLSATQRPLDEVARFLVGAQSPPASGPSPDRARTPTSGRRRQAGPTTTAHDRQPPSAAPQDRAPGAPADPGLTLRAEFAADEAGPRWRPVTIVDASEPRHLELRIEVPVEDLARIGQPVDLPSGATSQGPVRATIWTAIHPRLLDLIAAHRTTLIFVNSRRLAERLAAALNELAGHCLVGAHHGSLARPQRLEIEDALKAGRLRALVATSSLELGIDMGSVDLVVQIEAPPSVASGLQRVGRAGHRVGEISRGIVFPKYRGDLVACAAAARAMLEGRVEAIRYPRNPLDVLAQQIVAMTAVDEWHVDDLYATVRRAAPFATLGRPLFEGVLDMLSGRYPSDEFAELRPRVVWDRVGGRLSGREGARRVAIVNGGTIPDRGLYGVFLAGADRGAARVGELDEEMVFESRVGETFVLGASTWRIEEITHDRVLVSPAPGEPGKMPFWRGEGPGRPLEFGREIGELTRTLASMPRQAALARLTREHGLDARAAEQLLRYLDDQQAVTRALPDDRTILIERCRDELGDWRVCVLSPFGGRVLAPWAIAVAARVRERTGLDIEVMWTDEGFVARFPETEEPPDPLLLVPTADEVEPLVLRQLGTTALFAARFRECAARALLLPRRRPGQRTPLWQQRKRAYDLLQVASRYGSFPMLLEAYRECLRDVFDMPALAATLRAIAGRQIRLVTVDTATPSPFAASLLFGYVATYLYEGDAPLAERRAQALTIDQAQLRDLLGEAELRELLDADVIDDVERELQHLDGHAPARSVDSLHDLLLRIGDLDADELAARASDKSGRAWAAALVEARRALWLPMAGGLRLVAVEDAARYRDALGCPLPPGLPEALLAPVARPFDDLTLRYARTHGPFDARALAARFGLGLGQAEQVLHALATAGRLIEGAFRPGGMHREWCDPNVLTLLRRRSLARQRRAVEPVAPSVLGRFMTAWQGTLQPRAGLDALLDVIEQLQGLPLAASVLESEVLPARIAGYRPADLDTVMAAGEVVWVGVEPLGERDGRLALFLTDHLATLWRPPGRVDSLSPREAAILDVLRAQGAMFFAALHEAAGGGYPADTVEALWNLVWRGLVTNDSLHALRAFIAPPGRRRLPVRTGAGAFRSRRASPPAAQGRWSLVLPSTAPPPSATAWSAAVARQLLSRYGILTREVVAAEGLAGGFSGIYTVLRSLEDRGGLRRGYFVSGVSAMQFAEPAAVELLRALRAEPETPEVVQLAATDPANPYGTLLPWPQPNGVSPGPRRGPTRTVGAAVVLVNGALAAFVGRRGRPLLTCLPEHEPDRSTIGRAVAARLAAMAADPTASFLIEDIDGVPARTHAMARWLVEAGFVDGPAGFHLRRSGGIDVRGLAVKGHAPETAEPDHSEARPHGKAAGGPSKAAGRSRARARHTVSSPFAVLREAARHDLAAADRHERSNED